MPANFPSPFIVWIFLISATGLTTALGEYGAPGRLLIVGVLLIALFKSGLVILEFMELRHAPALWRRIVLGWLGAITTGILIAYLK